ncbi:MAG: flagellar hook-associated protein FlgK [bacterium]|nr:flagellar hook-associated protein FlgK [bacterium]
MVSLFNSLNIASNALSVNESAISVVSHNVANMNTEGYSKQRVNLATRNISGAIGDSVEAQIRANGGVMIANVMRYNDEYLNSYYRDQLSTLKQYQEQLDNMGDLAGIFDDLGGNGISSALKGFYDALNNLNEYPASSTARVNFIESAKTLTSIMNTKSAQLNELTGKALGNGADRETLETSKIYNQYGEFNKKLDELAEVNKALIRTQTGTLEANNLLDKRDMILNDISGFVNIKTIEKRNGSVDLYVGDVKMVGGAVVTGKLDIQTAKEYCKGHDIVYPDDWYTEDEKGNKIPGPAAVMNIVDENGDPIIDYANDQIRGGALGGMLHCTDLQDPDMNVGKAQESLNRLANTIANVFNALNTDTEHACCINKNDVTKLVYTTADNAIFVNSSGTGDITAGNMAINPELLKEDGCWNLACAYFENPDDFDENAVGNSKNVIFMLESRNTKQPALNGVSIEDFYTGLVGKIASGGSNMQALVDTQQEVVDSIKNEITANNSVDLNEELVNLVKYQTAYSASAQVFNVVNECLGVITSLGS